MSVPVDVPGSRVSNTQLRAPALDADTDTLA